LINTLFLRKLASRAGSSKIRDCAKWRPDGLLKDMNRVMKREISVQTGFLPEYCGVKVKRQGQVEND
jgi:hypothetical protein